MTWKGKKTIVQVFVVISLLSMINLIHFSEAHIEVVVSESKQNEVVNTDFTSTLSNKDFDKEEIEFDLSEMHSDYFTENLGQWNDHICFLAQTSFGFIGLGNDGVFYYILNENGGYVVKVTFQNADKIIPLGLEETDFFSNYFLGNDHGKWVREARSFYTVKYENVWPGIDIMYFFKNGNIKYDIIVNQYAMPELISFYIEGHRKLEIIENRLVISISESIKITDSELLAFYEDGTTEVVHFKKTGDSSYGFNVNKKDKMKLIIDPIIFSTSSIIGGSNIDTAKDIEIDGEGNIIILGETYSADFPNTTGAYQNESAGTQDLAITKMDPDATYLIFSTYIGGWHMEFPCALDVDDNGDIYATGETWATDFPTTNGSFCEDDPGGTYSLFVVKLSSLGNDLIYSTYVGSTVADWAKDIEVFNGNAYVVGHTYSYDFPYVEHPIDNAHGTAFFFILNQDGSNLIHTDFWGGYENEIAYSLEIDTNGDVVVGGVANSIDFPTTSGVYQENATDNSNGFLLRFRPSTHTLIFSTFIGGTEYEEINSIYLDNSGDIYFAGITKNPSSAISPFPTTPGAYDTQGSGGQEGFIGKMSNDGSDLIFSTFLGGDGKETVGSIDLDTQGNIYFTGSLDSDENFSVTPDAFDDSYNGEEDTLFVVLNPDGSDLLYCTYLGGNASDLGRACILASSCEIFILGTTNSPDFPITIGSYQSENNSYEGIFLTKFIIGNYTFLHEGWNLISIPYIQHDTRLRAVLDSITGSYDTVEFYNAADNFDNWKIFNSLKPHHLNDLEYINHIIGFWIHITNPNGILLKLNGMMPTENQEINLYPGWNMVGYPSPSIRTRDDALNNLVFNDEVDSIWTYDSSSGGWDEIGPSDSFEAGRGYWIHATTKCIWEVPL